MAIKHGHKAHALAAAATCLTVGFALAGCGSSRTQASGTAGAQRAVSATSASSPESPTRPPTSLPSSARSSATPSTSQKLPKGASTAIPKDPIAPKSIGPVMRHGKKAHPTVKVRGGASSFTHPADYTDGTKLKITRMTQGKVNGQGPGVFPGRAVTDFHITLSNGTKKSLLLQTVVVTVTYGSPARVAHPVYSTRSVDFAGSVKPGASKRAVYGFSVPAADRDDVTMTVDLDGVHQLAVFTGKVK